MERTFAGFWRDGAIIQPEKKHWSSCDCIFAIQKHDNSLDICMGRFANWDTVYWLDTTTPKELTPQEAFELLKVVNPKLEIIQKHYKTDYLIIDHVDAIINWGSTTEYPLQQKWRVPTDADKGKNCRFKDGDRDWTKRDNESLDIFCGVHYDKGFMVEDSNGEIFVYEYCEVLD